jgi:hypothetical protein
MNNKIGKFCNCTNKQECPSPGSNYECCSQSVPNGSPARFGLWMERSTCDPSKGLPKDAHLMTESYRNFGSVPQFGTREGFNDVSQEEYCMMRDEAMRDAAMREAAMQRAGARRRYSVARQNPDYNEQQDYEDENDPCKDLRKGLNLLLFIMLLAVIGGSLYYLKSQKRTNK